MRAAKVQASLRIRAVSPEPPLLAHTSSESRGTFRQKTRSLAPLNGWTCAVTICHDGMLEDTDSLDGAQMLYKKSKKSAVSFLCLRNAIKGSYKGCCLNIGILFFFLLNKNFMIWLGNIDIEVTVNPLIFSVIYLHDS